MHFFQKN